MKTIKLSVPSKTFLGGEYLALQGGPTLTLATAPRFSMQIEKSASSARNPFHPESPAGRYFEKEKGQLSGFEFQFVDPLSGMGGFGASSAQFALLNYFQQIRESLEDEGEKFFDVQVALSEYQKHVQVSSTGLRPSGADLVGQLQGGLTFFHRVEGQLQTYNWPFEDIAVLLFKTPIKLSTHQHLAEINTRFTEEQFQEMSKEILGAQRALAEINSERFLECLTNFSQQLMDLKLVCAETLALLPLFQKIPGVRLARGCGALGADVIAVFANQDLSLIELIKKTAETNKLLLVSTATQLAEGFKIDEVIRESAVDGRSQ